MLATSGDLVEMRLRDDVAEWKALAERLEARRVLDIGTDLEGLPAPPCDRPAGASRLRRGALAVAF